MMRQSRMPSPDEKIMKKLVYIAALTLGICSWAQAQVHFGPNSTRAIAPHAAMRDLESARPEKAANNAPIKPRRVLVECRDGSMHIAQVCRRHGGIARAKKPG
jgi:hypothetical protein